MSQGAEKFQPPEVGIEPGPQDLKANTLPRRCKSRPLPQGSRSVLYTYPYYIKKPTHVVQEETYADSSTDSSGDEDEEQTEEQPAIPRYIIPQKRSPPCKTPSGKQASARGSSVTPSSRPVPRQSQSPVARGGLRRSQRNRRAPKWMHSGQWQIGMRPHTFRVNQNEVIYL